VTHATSSFHTAVPSELVSFKNPKHDADDKLKSKSTLRNAMSMSRSALLTFFLLSCTIHLSTSFVVSSQFRSSTSRLLRRLFATENTMSTTPQVDPLATYGFPQPLILGSASFTRKLILKEMNVNYHIVVRAIDEQGIGDRSKDAPADLVRTLAQAKMDHLVREIQAGNCQDDLPTTDTDTMKSWIVLTGDQVVTCNGEILEKPESIEQARDFVARYAHHPPSTVGSCVLTHLPSGVTVSGVDTATIHFLKTIPADLIDRLVMDDEPVLSCAGGLMVEHPLVKEYIQSIDGTEDSVMGLSKDLVLQLLKELSEKLKDQGVEP
jgi:septum formation protein